MTRRKTTAEFVRDAILVHSDKYDYSNVEYIGNKSKVIIICKEHGEFLQNRKQHITQLHGCPKCVGGILYTHIEWIEKAKIFMVTDMIILKWIIKIVLLK
jgi:hypothetical protein